MKAIALPAPYRSQALDNAVTQFFFAPASAKPLAALRIGLALTLLLQAALVAPNFFDLYGSTAMLQGMWGEALNRIGLPGSGWLANELAPLGFSERQVLLGLAATYLTSLLFLAVGWRTRIAAVVAWATHLLLASSHIGSYGVDDFAHLFLFYLIFVPAGAYWSLDVSSGRVESDPTSLARLSLRVLQIHLAIAYLATGISKGMGAQWQSGEAIWRALMIPVYCKYQFAWLAGFPFLAKAIAWSTVLVEAGYAIFIWPLKTRKIWVPVTLSLHVGIGVLLGLTTFSLAMAVFTFSLFGLRADCCALRCRKPACVK